ncbi:MAG TPA: DNA cytosine methyltransferase [Usitatibacter sp.]|nr:DNA cytosine methyltransferase [Usitatibacter sp.]
MRALDLFCGAGLSSSGARAGGATLVGAVDLCPIATATYSANFPGAKVINKPLEDVSPSALRRQIGNIDLLLASPECTNHTCAKGSAPRSEESRATALQVVRFAKEFMPRWIVMENVVYMRPWSRYPELVQDLQCMGYHVKEQVLDATEFGVPQRRRRLFIVCDLEMEPSALKLTRAWGKQNVRDILDPDSKWEMTPLFKKGRAADTKARAKRAIAELGESKPFLIVYYGTDGCGGWQRLDRPLRTVTTVDRFALVRPSKDGHKMRMLQVSELKRAMGLAPTFELPKGTRRDKIRLLGNGVCPPVMKAVVGNLLKS